MQCVIALLVWGGYSPPNVVVGTVSGTNIINPVLID